MAQRIKVQDGRVVYQHTDSMADIDFYIEGNLYVRNNAEVGTDLFVAGTTTIQNNLNVNDSLFVTNSIDANTVTATSFIGAISGNASTATALETARNISASGDASWTVLFDGTADVTNPITLATVNSNIGTFGSSTAIPVVTVNGKGLITGVTTTSFSGTAPLSTSLAGGTAGSVVYQSAPDTTAFLPAGTASQVLVSGPSAPSWTNTPTLTGTNFTGIPNGALINNSVTIGSTSIPLGGTSSTLSGLSTVTSTSFIGNFTGNSSTASTLETGRTISTTGDATWSVLFDGSGNVTNPITLATVNSSPQTNAFNKFTVNSKGLVTATSPVTTADITALVDGTYVNISGDTMTGVLTLSGAPTAPLDAATKQYVDDIASGLNIHIACQVATLSNLPATYNNGSAGVGATLTGIGALPAIDGITLAVNDRILVKNQASQPENGIYVVTQTTANWILTRATDFDGSPSYEVQAGDATYIQEGSQAGTQWVQTTPGTITIGTSNIVFTQFGGPGTYTAGTGIDVSGTVISNTGVVSLAGTANQVSVSASTGNVTVSLPSSITIGGTFTAGLFAGSGASLTNIPNVALVNNLITIGSTNIALGGLSTTLGGLSTVTSTSFVGELTGNSSTATALQTSRAISTTGDATWSVSFNGSTDVSNPITLATVNASPQADAFRKITVNGKGLVTATSAVTTADLTPLLDSTYVNVTGDTMTGSLTAPSFIGPLTGNSSTASTLETGRTISATGDATWSVSFNGGADVSSAITLSTVNASPQIDTFRKITVNGKGLVTATSAVTTSDITTLVDGTYVNVTGDTMTGSLTAPSFIGPLSGNASTASTLQTSRTISATGDATWSVGFDGSSNVSSAITLATVNANIGTFNNVTVNSKGLVTAASSVAYLTGNQSITLSGDISGSGTTSIITTLPNINANIGTFNNLTVNAKGQVTSASNVAYLTGNQNISISGDASGSGTTSIGLTFATVNSNVGTFSYPTLTVNGKGLVTAISSNTPVTSVSSGTGISVSGATGSVTISNAGVTSLSGTASQVSVSGATGSVTVSLPSSVTITGTMTAGTFNATSTKRVKKAIRNLNKTYISNFSKLKPREYDRTDYSAHEFGFIAEEMIKVYPEVVGVDEKGNATGIDYGKLSTILTAKIQEQDETIKELQKQVNELISIVKGSK